MSLSKLKNSYVLFWKVNNIANLSSWILIIFIYYIYVYAPPFKIIPFGIDKVIMIWGYFYLYKQNKILKTYRIFNKELLGLLLIVACSLIISLIHKTFNSLFIQDLLLIVEVIPTSCALYFAISTSKYPKNPYSIIIYASIVAGLMTLFLILNPDTMFMLKNEVLKYPERLKETFVYRGYGLSDGLMFSYPVISGFSIGLVLLNGKNYNITLIILCLLLGVISIMTNARSGFVPFTISIMILLFYRFHQLLRISLLISLVLVCLGNFVSDFIEDNDMLNMSVEWSKSTWYIVEELLKGNKVENMEALTDDMIIWPQYIDEWIIGSGLNIFYADINRTDIGYLIRLSYGGILYLVPWIILIFCMFKRLYKIDINLSILLFLSLLYLNYKSDFFIVNPASRFFFLIYVWAIMHNSYVLCKTNKIV